MKTSARIRNLTPSATVEMAGKIEDFKRNGVDILSFSLGEPDFDTPKNICDAAKRAIDSGYTRYTPAAGIRELREAICGKLRKDNGLDYAPEEIIVTTGAKQALYGSLQAICNPGDEVIVPAPHWVSYLEMVKLSGATPVVVRLEEKNGYQLDIEKIRDSLTEHTRAIIINSPNNPTGAVYSRECLTELGRLSAETGLVIISDDIYEKLVFDGAEFHSVVSLVPECRDNVIVVNGFSKAYAMTGWRIGYAAGPSGVIKAMASLQGHMTSNTNTMTQKACVEALEGPQDSVRHMRQEFGQRRDFIVKRLNSIPGIFCPAVRGAFYVMPNIHSYFGRKYGNRVIGDSADFADLLLEEAHVAVVPGVAFGAPDTIRMTYANSLKNIEEGLNRLEACLRLTA